MLQHVLPRGLQKVRHYGFLRSGSKTDYELLGWIVTLSLNMIYVLTFKQQASAAKQHPKYQHCGAELGCGLFERYIARPTAIPVHDSS